MKSFIFFVEVGDLGLTLLAKLMRALTFFSWNDTRYSIQITCFITPRTTSLSIPTSVINAEFSNSAICFLNLFWVCYNFWSNKPSCDNCSKRSWFYLFFWVVVWQIWSGFRRLGSGASIIDTIFLLPSLSMLFPLDFPSFFQELHTSGKIIAEW